ncbi:unnamed protein product [Ranitomeya imitator]|uniref:ribonuclease H n=1 Tax=Ranitomeya imitator TaxID=111125 RepID=A0ABN9MCX6_9NEOB|nr:unnamed protein product [Ranitomeya imitator]
MVGFPMPAGLNESMSLAIQIGRRLRERKSVHHLAVLPELKPEPMQCDRTLTRVERQEHRRLNGLCFYCGDSTHAISDCPKRTKRFARSATIGTVQSKFLLSVTLICSLSSYSVMAFVDSGAALNLMDLEYAKRCGFFLEPLRCPIPLRGIDATPLAKNKPQYWTQLTMCMAPAHQEVIRFLVLHNLHDVVVLGLPWLQAHNPVLDWKSMSVSSWGCQGVHGDVPFLSISSSTPSEVPEFLSDYRDVFDEPKSDALPPHRDCDCAINLIPGSKFPKGRLFNLSVPEHTAMRSYVKESLEKGHIRPSSSPLGAGFFFVAKKDGSLRPCIDYRLLNKITVKFQYPLPLLSDLFARIKGASSFTKIDLRGAYNLVRIKQGDEWKTAFNTPEGHFEYLVMPFGLANAPSVFQSFMHDIFREYLDKFLIVYLDDILIFSDDWESHVKQVRTVFQVLRANSLFVKGSKCLFGVQKVSFLGFIFSPSTIEMDPVKVQAIHDWTQPTSLKSLQKFLGFANFYRRFICNFSSIAKPLTDLTKKGADVVNWSSAAVEAFQELKRRFCCAPVLCQPDVSLPFQVEVDASEIGAGAVLSQRDLIVGAFGAGTVAVYRARPVVTVDAELLLNPMILNPENRTCLISISDTLDMMVTCLTVIVCMDVSGRGIPDHMAMKANLELDWLKQKGAVKRTLFRDYGAAQHSFTMILGKDTGKLCLDFVVYLREESEFRDKLTPITVSLNYSLHESVFSGDQDLKPILNLYKEAKLQKQVCSGYKSF